MAYVNELLYEQQFTGTSFTVTHNLDRLNLDYRIVCSGDSRPDLVQIILFSAGTERDSFDVYLTSSNIGLVQVLDTTRYPVNLPSPENNLKLVNILENDYLLDIYQSGSTSLTISTTSITWDAQVVVGTNYTHSIGGTDIQINSSGTYQITYSISIDKYDINPGRNTTRRVSKSWLSLNGSEIPRSSGYIYHRRWQEGEGTLSKTVISPLNNLDVITLDSLIWDDNAGANDDLLTIPDSSNITITKLNNG